MIYSGKSQRDCSSPGVNCIRSGLEFEPVDIALGLEKSWDDDKLGQLTYSLLGMCAIRDYSLQGLLASPFLSKRGAGLSYLDEFEEPLRALFMHGRGPAVQILGYCVKNKVNLGVEELDPQSITQDRIRSAHQGTDLGYLVGSFRGYARIIPRLTEENAAR